MMIFLFPQALRVINLWKVGNKIDVHFYWRFWYVQVWMVNVLGFCAMWLTVLMTTECYLHVFKPGYADKIIIH